ncbi:MAG TPA: SH3 domain-containing protein [Candidatus Omnitrophota bacterium]|nr:SH3 domain-containing protein [Candidatus Omnitrophota bacterium]HPT06617.1 SH3 domain-containing protein [Candidatus Omnitrophota bacterium]
MMRTCIAIIAILVCAGCQKVEQFEYAAPVSIPHTARQMKSPGFWIGKIPYPDLTALTPSEIVKFNYHIAHQLKLTTDFKSIPSKFSGTSLRQSFSEDLQGQQRNARFDKSGRKVSRQFFDQIKANINMAAIPASVPARFGFVSRYADQRILPSDEILTGKPFDFEFDELQNSSLDIGTPLVIVAETKDQVWVYAHAPTSSGWVKKSRVALCSEDDFKQFSYGRATFVVIAPKADIYLDEGLTKYYDYVRMGAAFPGIGASGDAAQIIIPVRSIDGKFVERAAFVKYSDVHIGYLPFTSRVIIEQAFKLLNAPYGWGGTDGEQDCSSFIQQIFATVGIDLPRNSAAQGNVGKNLGVFDATTPERKKIFTLIKEGIGGITLIQLKGHVLLYLGMDKGRFYAIHETYGYGQFLGARKISRIVNRVVVSDLSLGKGSQKGSLLERVVSIRKLVF